MQRISRCIARRKSCFMTFPLNLSTFKQDFYNIAGFPSVLGAMDCTHIPIVSPGDNAEVYRNRKGFFSINVQAICNANRYFTNVVARWCGSTHDSRIFENSVIRDRFENNEVDGLLLGDNGYLCKRYLMTPLLYPVTNAEKAYNKSHIKKEFVSSKLLAY